MGRTVSGMHHRMRRVTTLPTWALLGGLVALSTLLRTIAALDVPTPLIGPDEQTYAQLGQSIYEHGRFEIWDQPNRFYTLTYPLLVGLALSHGDVEVGYAGLKVLQALVMSLTAVPVFFWGRTFMSRGWALAAAALTLVVPGLAYSGLVMTEVLFLPVATVTAWLCARALERPSAGRQLAAAAMILVACATRLQAVVFFAVVVSAVVLKALLDRRPRDVLRFWPGAAVLAAAGIAWAVHRLGGGKPASELLAAYRAAGDVSYDGTDMLQFVAWHFADAVLFTCVVPTVALVLLLAVWRTHGEATRAFLAVAASLLVWLVIEVGVFASRNVNHLAERDLLALVPLLFLALAAWLDRGAPRPRVAAGAVAAVIAAAVLYLPVRRFVTHSEFADAFSIIPLLRLRESTSGLVVDLLLTIGAGVLLAAALALPRRYLVAVPASIAVLLGTASIIASDALGDDARVLRNATTGAERTWVDDAVSRPVTLLYTSDLYTVAPWSLRFWNDRVANVVRLDDVYLPGPVPQPLAGTGSDGSLVVDGERVDADYVLAAGGIYPEGEAIDAGGPLTLWNVDRPLRLSRVVRGVRFDNTVDKDAWMTVYDCTGGSLSYAVNAAAPRLVEIRQNNIAVDSRQLAAGERWEGTIPALPNDGVCTFALRSEGDFGVEQLTFTRS
jgi:hypothetical protein